jgi:hypothetical protein
MLVGCHGRQVVLSAAMRVVGVSFWAVML